MNNFNEIINSLDFELDELKQVKKNIYLNNREMQILKMYDIDFQNCVDMNDLLYSYFPIVLLVIQHKEHIFRL